MHDRVNSRNDFGIILITESATTPLVPAGSNATFILFSLAQIDWYESLVDISSLFTPTTVITFFSYRSDALMLLSLFCLHLVGLCICLITIKYLFDRVLQAIDPHRCAKIEARRDRPDDGPVLLLSRGRAKATSILQRHWPILCLTFSFLVHMREIVVICFDGWLSWCVLPAVMLCGIMAFTSSLFRIIVTAGARVFSIPERAISPRVLHHLRLLALQRLRLMLIEVRLARITWLASVEVTWAEAALHKWVFVLVRVDLKLVVANSHSTCCKGLARQHKLLPCHHDGLIVNRVLRESHIDLLGRRL